MYNGVGDFVVFIAKFDSLQSSNLPQITATTDNIELYPNPASTECHIVISNNTAANVLLTIRDVAGRELYKSSTVLVSGRLNIPIPVDNLMPGLYFVTADIGGNVTTKKLVVSR